jgi:superfamily II DNA or RNA helicase
MSLAYEDIQSFVETMNPPYPDVSDQVMVLWTIIKYRMSSHNIATGFGKTYLSYLLAQYTQKVLEGKTLIIVPRIALVLQGVGDFNDYMQTIAPDTHLKVYGICSDFRNNCTFDDADVYIGTYQSICEMPEDLFSKIETVIADEGHSAKARTYADCIKKCKNAEYFTAISGTMQYVAPADLLTIEQYCGPMVTNYPAIEQIRKGRLPKIAVQQIVLKHTDGAALYRQMLDAERLPLPGRNRAGEAMYPVELAATYRRLEFQYLSGNMHLFNYILALCKNITDQNKNVLVIFKNRIPAVNLFELANARGQKAHLYFGSTKRDVREGIKAQIERENGWIVSCTDGVMSMGISINNLHALIICMIGHSPHVVLQSVGRMLRNHPDKFDTTICYDIINDFSQIGTQFDLDNANERHTYYLNEGHPIYEKQFRIDTAY